MLHEKLLSLDEGENFAISKYSQQQYIMVI